MRQLHVIGFTSDHAGLILAGKRGAKTGGFILEIDDTLLGHLARARQAGGDSVPDPGDLAAAVPLEVPAQPAQPAPHARPAVQSGLSPREIQARLRSGRTVEEVAAEAGVSTDWVDRFAAPVLAEQAAAVARAADAVLHTPRRGHSDRPLQAAVLRNLADRGVALAADEFASGWSAFHLADHDWLIRFRFRSRGRALVAEWNLDSSRSALTSRNRLGTELGFVAPGRPVAVLSDFGGAPERPPRRARPPAGARKAVKRAAAVAGASPPRRRAAARKAPAKKAAAEKTAAKKPALTKARGNKTAVDKTAAKKLAVKKAAVKTAAVRGATAPAGRAAATGNVAPVRRSAATALAAIAPVNRPDPVPAPAAAAAGQARPGRESGNVERLRRLRPDRPLRPVRRAVPTDGLAQLDGRAAPITGAGQPDRAAGRPRRNGAGPGPDEGAGPAIGAAGTAANGSGAKPAPTRDNPAVAPRPRFEA